MGGGNSVVSSVLENSEDGLVYSNSFILAVEFEEYSFLVHVIL
jgi:hypothetical protein